MAEQGISGTLTVDDKVSDLSSATIYGVAHGLIRIRMADSVVEALSRGANDASAAAPVPSNPTASHGFLAPEVSRAALAVLLVKLLRSDPLPLPGLPALVERSLAIEEEEDGSGLGLLDFGSPSGFLHSICRLNNTDVADTPVSHAEIRLLQNSSFVSVAICALLDTCSSPLAKVIDAVAALSCEAARANVAAAFNPRIPADGLFIKDEWDVAAYMNTLLLGSKLVGQRDLVPFEDVPVVHGSFRETTKQLHSHTRIQLNTTPSFKRSARDFVKTVGPLAEALYDVGDCSLSRAKLVLESIVDVDLHAKVAAEMGRKCPGKDSLRVEVSYCADNIAIMHDAYALLVKVREILAWEAALALLAIETDDSIEKKHLGDTSSIKENGKPTKNEQKSERKKEKKKTLAKGTSTVRELLMNKISHGNKLSMMDITNWAHEFSLYFDPKDAELETLITKIKEIAESNEATGARRIPKTPKGTRDFGQEAMAIRERAFSIIVSVFKKHGAGSIDTPVFELRETLMGKYGEDSKLIYDLADQGGELCSLRYDLTVPFARYLATNKLGSLKRYHIGKVYRRDNPSKGRYREFYQCDFDIAGQYEPMDPDAEVIRVLTELLDELNIGSYEVKLNHRKLLDGMLEICGVPSNKFRTVCSSIDKLDKLSFEQVRKELVEEKGLAGNIADKIGCFVSKRGPPLEILTELKKEDSKFLQNGGAVCALNELEVLFRALENSRCLSKIVFDLSLARGLDYYTGVIFEAVFKGVTQVGSIAAGGRYDNLVGMFSGKQVPAVGVSLGIERVFTIMEQMQKENNQVIRASETQVLVAILGNDVPLAHKVVSELWDAGIRAEHALNKKPMNHISRAADSGIPWLVIVGESEVNEGIIKLKNIKTKEEEKVPRSQMVEELHKKLGIS